MLGFLARPAKRRRFRQRVHALLQPYFEAMDDRTFAELLTAFGSAAFDDLSDEGATPEQGAIYVSTALLTNFATERVQARRRQEALEQLERYAIAANQGQGASAMPSDELALLTLLLDDRAHQWVEAGSASEIDAELLLSEVVGALRGTPPEARSMGRLMVALRHTPPRGDS